MVKKSYFIIAIVLLASSLYSQPTIKPGPPREIIATITNTGRELCPDKRLDYFGLWADLVDSTIVLKGETSSKVAYDSVLARVQRKATLPIRNEMILLPAPNIDKKHGVVTISTANMRGMPAVESELINQAILGETVRILKERSFFYFIQMPDKYLGWIMKSSVQAMSDDEYKQWQKYKKVVYNRNCGQVLRKKKSDAYPVSDLVRGSILALVKKEGKWLKVRIPDGREGYILAKNALDYEQLKSDPHPDGKDIVETALQFFGIPYLWGGTSTKGFDCSGFTKTVYRMHGIDLPRDANMQVKIGEPVQISDDYANLKPGDLVFFGKSADRITHVGLYIGDKKFIHSDGYVHINSFDPADKEYSEYRVRGLRVVCRIVK